MKSSEKILLRRALAQVGPDGARRVLGHVRAGGEVLMTGDVCDEARTTW